MTSRFLFIISALMACGPVVAEDADAPVGLPLYESMADLQIGRVFLDPAERRHLDELRNKTVPDDSTQSFHAASDEPDLKVRHAAGFIVRGTGDALHWRDGDFVRDAASDPGAATAFPGDVEIKRHPVQQEPPRYPPADGGGDEARTQRHGGGEQDSR